MIFQQIFQTSIRSVLESKLKIEMRNLSGQEELGECLTLEKKQYKCRMGTSHRLCVYSKPFCKSSLYGIHAHKLLCISMAVTKPIAKDESLQLGNHPSNTLNSKDNYSPYFPFFSLK